MNQELIIISLIQSEPYQYIYFNKPKRINSHYLYHKQENESDKNNLSYDLNVKFIERR